MISDGQDAAEYLARIVATYYNGLVREGVPADAAMMLAARYQAQIVELGHKMAAQSPRPRQHSSIEQLFADAAERGVERDDDDDEAGKTA